MADGKPRGLLLRSPILEEAERWIALRPRTAPMPTAEIVSFIAESRRATLRQSDLLMASLGAGLLLAVGFAGLFHWQTVRATLALDTTEQIANTLVIDLGQDPRVVSLSPDLRREMFDRAIQGYDRVIKLEPKKRLTTIVAMRFSKKVSLMAMLPITTPPSRTTIRRSHSIANMPPPIAIVWRQQDLPNSIWMRQRRLDSMSPTI